MSDAPVAVQVEPEVEKSASADVTRDPIVSEYLTKLPANSRVFFEQMEKVFLDKASAIEDKARKQIDRARQDAREARAKVVQLETFVDQQRLEVNRLTEELSKVKVAPQTGLTELMALRGENTELKLEISRRRDASKTLHVRDQTIDALRREVSDLKNRLEQALQKDVRADNENLRFEIRDLRRRMAQRENEVLEADKAAGQKHAEEIAAKDASIKAIQERSDGFQREAERLGHELARLEKQAGAV